MTGEPAPPGRFRVVFYGGMRGEAVAAQDYDSFDEADAAAAEYGSAAVTDDRGNRPIRALRGKLRSFSLREFRGQFYYDLVADFPSLQEAEQPPRRWEYLCDEHGGRPRLKALPGGFRVVVTSSSGPDQNGDRFVLEYEILGDFNSAEEAFRAAQGAASGAPSREYTVYNDRGERLTAIETRRG